MQLATVVRGGGTQCHSVPNVVLPTRIVLAFAINVAPNSFRFHQNLHHRQFNPSPHQGRRPELLSAPGRRVAHNAALVSFQVKHSATIVAHRYSTIPGLLRQ